MGLLFQHQLPVKNVSGIRERREAEIRRGFQMSNIHRKLSTIYVIDFDPRPKSCRHVEARHINNPIKDLQVISQNTKDLSMRETQLEIRYEDYEVADIDVSQPGLSS